MPNRLLPPACWSTAKQRIRHSPGFGIAPEIMRRQFADANFCGELFDDMPDQLFRYSFAPNSPRATHAPEKVTRVDTSGRHPVIQ